MAVPDDRDQYSGGDLLEIDPNSRMAATYESALPLLMFVCSHSEESCRNSPKWVKKMLAKNTAM